MEEIRGKTSMLQKFLGFFDKRSFIPLEVAVLVLIILLPSAFYLFSKENPLCFPVLFIGSVLILFSRANGTTRA